MARLLHIRILEFLQHHEAVEHWVDIKPPFINELETLEQRKEFKAELDYLTKQGLIKIAGKYDFLSWTTVDGLYDIEEKKIGAHLTGDWETYLTTKRNSRRHPAEKEQPVIAAEPVKMSGPPVKLTRYPNAADRAPVPTPIRGEAVNKTPVEAANTPPLVEPTPVIIPAEIKAVNEPETAPDKSGRIYASPIPRPEDESVIITARTAQLKPRDEPEPAPVVRLNPTPLPAQPVKAKQPANANSKPANLVSINNMPLGAASLHTTKQGAASYKNGVQAYQPQAVNAPSGPFSGLEVISLNPVKPKPKKSTGALILAWAITALAFVLIVLIYLIFRSRY